MAATVLTPGSRRPLRPLAGTPTMVTVVLRRNWGRLLAWFAYVVGLLGYVGLYYRRTFTTQRALDDFAALSSSAGMRAITGEAADPATLGGAVWTKIWMTLALGLAFGVVLLVTRNGRADEAAGRSELLRSRVLGIHASSVATWAVVALLCVLAGAGASVVAVLVGLDPAGTGHSGSWLLGLSVTGVGLVALGLSAVAGQVASSARGANALGCALVGVAYLLRMTGDLGGGGATWASPIGWGEETRPWGRERWWPLALQLALALALLALATVLEERRDHGSGLLPDRAGRPGAPRRWATPAGLSLRLGRGALLGWTVTVVLAGLVLGSVISSMQDLLRDASPEVAQRLGGTGAEALTAVVVRLLALLVAVFAIQATLPLVTDEAAGPVEAELAGALSRRRWALGRLALPVLGSAALLALGGACTGAMRGAAVHDPGEVWRLALDALAYWPAVMVLVGAVVLVFGWWPRAATVSTWVLLAAVWLVEMVGDTSHLPTRVLDATPFRATPPLPAGTMSWTPLVVMTGIAAALVVLGVGRFERRDIRTE